MVCPARETLRARPGAQHMADGDFTWATSLIDIDTSPLLPQRYIDYHGELMGRTLRRWMMGRTGALIS
ncbi:MAG: hypothetical protein BWY85_00988 [Firmicutes bacterium ADurb.Bin506]|nr:MAG: hypothetical protein BWY85_00988 [Firmicutes bacterium ADurb.Bin506]